jgi:F0F1-type ATP synthase assembly protein I
MLADGSGCEIRGLVIGLLVGWLIGWMVDRLDAWLVG